MQLNVAVKEAIKILSEIHVGNMTPMAEEACKSAIKILEAGLQLMKQEQRPVAWIDVKPNPFDPSCRGAASVQDHALPPGEHKLYAAPQPNRKPLKDKQIIRWITSGEYNVTTNNWASHISFARAVEAAHGIK